MNARILAISWEMPPLSGPRAVQVTRTLSELATRQWTSRVICFGPRSARYQQDYPVEVEAVTGGAVRRIPVASPEERFFFRALWRVCPPIKRLPDEKRVWVPSAVRAALRALDAQPADVLVSFAQPWSSHMAALRVHARTGLPWVAHFSDPWVDSPYERGPAWQMRRRARMEHAVIENATRVVFVNRQTADAVMRKYPPQWRTKVDVVPQGFVSRAPREDAAEPGAPLRMVYTGRFYHGLRGPGTFFEALARLNAGGALAGRLAVAFYGQDMDRYRTHAAQLGLTSIVSFAGRVSPMAAQDAAARADVLLVIDAPSGEPSLFLPSKLIDYLPLGRPILGITPVAGPSADVLRAVGYEPVDPTDAGAIAAAVARLLEAHSAGTLRRSAVHEQGALAYDIRETTRLFERVLAAARGAA